MPAIEPNQQGATAAAVVPGQGKVIALSGFTAGNIYGKTLAFSSPDAGTTWELINPNAASIRAIGIHFVPSNPNTFWITGGHFKTTDGGITFSGRDTIWEAIPAIKPIEKDQNNLDKGNESISVSQDGSIILLSPHESYDLFKSADGGINWTNIGNALPSGIAFPSFPLVIDANVYLVGCSFTVNGTWNTGGGTKGIYRTETGGQSWSLVSSETVVGSPLVLNGKIYWSTFNGSDGGLIVSSDNGKTWAVITASSLNYWIAPVALPSGLIASLSNSGSIVTSPNGSPPWTTVGPAAGLSDLRGMVYDPTNKSFLVWQRNGPIRRLKVN